MRFRTSFVLFVFLLSFIGAGTWVFANVLPAGTVLHVRTVEPIFADSSRPGTRVRGIVYRPVIVRKRVVVPSGAPATLVVVDRSSNRHRLDVSVHSIRVGGTRYTLSTNDVQLGGSNRRGRRGLVGAGVGAAVGGMVGGGAGAAVGATTGAGVGLVAGSSGRQQLSVPAHTRLQFRVNRSMRIGR